MTPDIIELMMRRLLTKHDNDILEKPEEGSMKFNIGLNIIKEGFLNALNINNKLVIMQLAKLTDLKNIETEYNVYDLVYPTY